MVFAHWKLPGVACALHYMKYNGCISADVLPWPDPAGAAQQTIASFRHFFPKY
jgi:hypothetical protein